MIGEQTDKQTFTDLVISDIEAEIESMKPRVAQWSMTAKQEKYVEGLRKAIEFIRARS